jgi:sulfate/thiosulfate transport system ATP-binding protein
MEVADRIVVMNEGRIEQVGTPDEVYDHPASPFVLQFLGDVNLFRGRLGHAPGGVAPDDVSYVRPHELDLVAEPDGRTFEARLSQVLTLGPLTRLEFEHDGRYLDVELPRARWLQLRDALGLSPGVQAHLRPRRVTRFVAGGDAEIDHDPAAMI